MFRRKNGFLTELPQSFARSARKISTDGDPHSQAKRGTALVPFYAARGCCCPTKPRALENNAIARLEEHEIRRNKT